MNATNEIRPTFPGTVAILAACVIGYFLSLVDAPSSRMAMLVSLSLGTGIGVSFLFDWRLGLRNLLRVDVFALMALYFLTYFEFLFPQSRFDMLVIPDDVVRAVHLTLFGYGALALGRHITFGAGHALDFLGKIKMRNQDYLLVFAVSFFLWGLPMWMAVNFNPMEWFNELLKPRFAKAWGRGRYGNLATLLNELQLFGYILPPLAGVILARRREYAKFAVFLVMSVLCLLWFVDFTNGTRNVLAIHIAGFLGGFLIIQQQLKLKTIAICGVVAAVSFVILADHMLAFRNMGLRRYVELELYKPAAQEMHSQYSGDFLEDEPDVGYFVDYNLWRIAQLAAVFPSVYDHLQWNLPFVALTKPIPRAFWPGKPTDLKVGLEEAIGVEGYTVAATWIGEAYVAGGILWVVTFGLIVGIYCRFWNQLASYIGSPFALMVFASGFYAVLLLMRSLMFFTTALLPSIALITIGTFIYLNRTPARDESA